MLGENIKTLRKEKGYTQEELAIRLNVVRQTVSKWEKGLSVPDAEMLQKIADILDVNIKQLLGASIDVEKDNNELVGQLARINEQMVIRNRRSRRIWQIVGIVAIVFVVFNILLVILNAVAFSAYKVNTESYAEEIIVEEEEIMIEQDENLVEP